MQLFFLFGAFLFVPILTLAHEGEHTTTLWYQEPTILIAIGISVAALSILIYGLITKQKGLIMIPSLFLIGITATGLISLSGNDNSSTAQLHNEAFGSGYAVTLYKSPSCGCCSRHAAILEEVGFDVTIEKTDDMQSTKQKYNIPQGKESCHTSVIGDYVVEGHVPSEAIEKLLTEKPDIAGIGLSGMPIGTPGMPGQKQSPFEVYQLSHDGEVSPYMTI